MVFVIFAVTIQCSEAFTNRQAAYGLLDEHLKLFSGEKIKKRSTAFMYMPLGGQNVPCVPGGSKFAKLAPLLFLTLTVNAFEAVANIANNLNNNNNQNNINALNSNVNGNVNNANQINVKFNGRLNKRN